jgi:imidazolonepropionase-like amidohydrolase
MIIIGFALMAAAIVLSAESFRTGFYADDQEIAEIAESGGAGCGLLVALVVCAVLALLFWRLVVWL